MYRPKAFQEDNIDKLITFMKANSFATLVSIVDNIPYASHIPLVVEIEGEVIKLVGHLAKQNPQWKSFNSTELLAIFTGAHSYISPTLYEKHESVPTWNYIAVHAYGIPKIITKERSPKLMNQMIDGMIETYEANYKSHWHTLSDGFRENMMNGIVGLEIEVTRLEGKYKLSQNRSKTEQKTISDALLNNLESTVQAIGAEIKNNLKS